jgi:hypothetical protein
MAYACDDSFKFCEGLGDRVKGVVSAFALALMGHSEYAIRWVNPVNLEEFFSPRGEKKKDAFANQI